MPFVRAAPRAGAPAPVANNHAAQTINALDQFSSGPGAPQQQFSLPAMHQMVGVTRSPIKIVQHRRRYSLLAFSSLNSSRDQFHDRYPARSRVHRAAYHVSWPAPSRSTLSGVAHREGIHAFDPPDGVIPVARIAGTPSSSPGGTSG